MSNSVVVALGSNLASATRDRTANLYEAVRRIGRLGEVKRVSSFYDTAPVGYLEQPRFLNGALLLWTDLGPVELMRGLLEVERGMGRIRDVTTWPGAKGPRVIDLDMLLYGGVVMDTPELTLPHPAMAERRFVLEPLAEIAPEMLHPVMGLTVAELLAQLPAGG